VDLLLEKSAWSDGPVPPATTAAFHVEGLARWLRAAGAEPRLALALVSGDGAARTLAAALGAHGIEVVPAPATVRTPVHPDLAAHQGDHFNNRLYWVDGFEGSEGEAALAALEARSAGLKRMATWVLVVIESPASLARLERVAPRLKAAFDRRVVLLDPGVADMRGVVVEPTIVADWRRRQSVAEIVYHEGCTPARAPTYDDFSRLVRSGYASLHVELGLDPERRRLMDLWQGLTVTDPAPAAAEATLRHRPPAAPTALAPLLAGDPAARYACGLPVDDVPLLAGMAQIRAGIAEGRAMSSAEIEGLRTRAATAEIGPHLRVHIELLVAAAAAAADDVATCEDALRGAVARVRTGGPIAPELAFEVEEKSAQLHALLNRRGPAKEALDRLDDAARLTAAPFYAGRLALAKGDYTAPLDPAKARTWYHQARHLFDAHRYADWAAQATRGHG
jgi:hypothetical protein